MIPSRKLISFLIVTCFAVSFVSGQQNKKEKEVKLQFVSFPRSNNPQPLEILLDDNKTIQIKAPTNSISPHYKVKSMKIWRLGKSHIDEEGNFSFTEYGKINSLRSDKQLILVIRKGKSDADGLKLIPINNSLITGFGGGKEFVMNASKVNIAADIGGKKITLKPLKHKIIKSSPFKEKGKHKFTKAYIYISKGDKLELFFSSVWRFSNQARNMVFIYHDPNNKKLRLHSIRDYL